MTLIYQIFPYKWADKSSTSYDMLDFKSYIKNFNGHISSIHGSISYHHLHNYQLINLKILQKYALDLQSMTFNYQIITLQGFYITFKI